MKNLIALLVFCGGFAAWYLYRQQHAAETSLAESKLHVEAFAKSLEIKRAEFNTIVRALELKRQAAAKLAEVKAIEAQEDALENEIIGLQREKGQLIGRIRQSVAGQVIPEWVLKDGRKFNQVRIMKADDAGVSISSASGVQRVLPKDLPDEWRQRLHYP